MYVIYTDGKNTDCTFHKIIEKIEKQVKTGDALSVVIDKEDRYLFYVCLKDKPNTLVI